MIPSILAQAELSTSEDEKTVTVDDAPEMDVIAFGKTIIVKNRAKSVLSFGGNIQIEGRVEEDVVAIGGSISQKQDAYVGGHVFAVGGSYEPESQTPKRGPGKETVMIAAFEEELRDMAQNPTQIFSPSLSWGFFALRLLSVLFWFVVTFIVTTLAPGAVSRAVARFHLSTAKVVGLGLAAFVLATVITVLCSGFLPEFLSIIIGLMVLFLMVMSFVIGRVAMQVSIGKMIQRRFMSEHNQSETIAILIGVIFWTTLMSLPYIWIIGELALFAAGIGLVLTARSKNGWQRE